MQRRQRRTDERSGQEGQEKEIEVHVQKNKRTKVEI
jgi:hypothetical protein